MEKSKKTRLFVAGHLGMVGSAIVRQCKDLDYDLVTRTKLELDLTRQSEVEAFFKDEKIDYVICSAAKVGGIFANMTEQTEFLYQNGMIALNLIHTAAQAKIKKFVFLGSSCIYPRECPQPIREEYLLTGPLEPTNEAYALAKIMGVKFCEKLATQHGLNFMSVLPCNLYGPYDNFAPESSHVIPGLMRRFHFSKVESAPKISVWGSGKPRREFLYVDDLAKGVLTVLEKCNGPLTINIGSSEEVTILELAQTIKEVVGYRGEIVFDSSKPDGTPRKILENQKIRSLGWQPNVGLKEGLTKTYKWILENSAL